MTLRQQLSNAVRRTLSRRRFLSALGAATASASLPTQVNAGSRDAWDLIVVGGGNAGMPATRSRVGPAEKNESADRARAGRIEKRTSWM